MEKSSIFLVLVNKCTFYFISLSFKNTFMYTINNIYTIFDFLYSLQNMQSAKFKNSTIGDHIKNAIFELRIAKFLYNKSKIWQLYFVLLYNYMSHQACYLNDCTSFVNTMYTKSYNKWCVRCIIVFYIHIVSYITFLYKFSL